MLKRQLLLVVSVLVLALTGSAWASENALFVYSGAGGGVGEYSTSGVSVNTSFITPGATGYWDWGFAGSQSDLFVTNGINMDTVAEYSTSGGLVNSSLITGLACVQAMAVSGNDLFVYNGSTIGEYTTSGAVVNASLITGLSGNCLGGLAVSGDDIFVDDYGTGKVAEYTTSGLLVNASLVSGLWYPEGLTVSGSDLFVANYNTVGEYTTSGAVVNSALVTSVGNDCIYGLSVSGSDLFLSDYNGTVGEYTTSGGVVNSALLTGLNDPEAVYVDSALGVPEPATWSSLIAGVGLVGLVLKHRPTRA